MEKFDKPLKNLKETIDESLNKINFDKLSNEEKKLEDEISHQDFWLDSKKAQKTMQELANIQRKINPWKKINSEFIYLSDLIELNDSKLDVDIDDLIKSLNNQISDLKFQMRFSGPYDSHNAIVSIYAGAGGNDAQDWTQMLLRMYTRWLDKNSFKATILTESPGEEAGLKSVTMEIDGQDIYGLLKSEHGVHRLVRQSPFNTTNTRETSFAKVEIIPVIESPEELDIDPKDLKIDVFRAGGHGGQSVNTTDSAVRITHIPTGINVSIQNERSQIQNKEMAMTIIRSKLTQLKIEQHKENINDIKGPSQSAEWGSQIRSYVLHPYKQVKDLRTGFETSDVDSILDGNIDKIIDAYLNMN
jgi:peptide chain release factor 2